MVRYPHTSAYLHRLPHGTNKQKAKNVGNYAIKGQILAKWEWTDAGSVLAMAGIAFLLAELVGVAA